jgi:hypothetical protein
MDLPYSTITRTVDSIEGTVTEVITSVTLRIYPEPLQVNQWNFPTLVGKQTVMFYLAADGLTFTPKPSDEITYLGEVYRVNSIQAHTAHGKTILYKLIGVKG